jgi:hypothetical protein
MNKDRDSGSKEEEKGKERLIKLRDTGDENEMVAVKEDENEQEEERSDKENDNH